MKEVFFKALWPNLSVYALCVILTLPFPLNHCQDSFILIFFLAPGPEVIKNFMLNLAEQEINNKLPTVVGILTFISKKIAL